MMHVVNGIHIHCAKVNFLVSILYYQYVKYNHWRKPGEGYARPPYYFKTSYESIVISK